MYLSAISLSREVSPWLVVPFGLLLVLIAVMPLTPQKVKHWWERYYPAVSVGLAAVVAIVYFISVPDGGHAVAHTLLDYISFICLVGSLFVVCGGVHIKTKGEATPINNVVFLVLGAFLANLIGTTGASMVLIRPWIRMNKIRISPFHIVFFIFIISNVGGALTPVGDPPLFLGYLRGVPFFWLIEHVILQWIATLVAILAAFYCFDLRSFRHMPRKLQIDVRTHPETWQFEGNGNILLLLAIIGAVFVPDRYFIREIIMVGVTAISWRITPKFVHAENHFSFGPIKEVALLFAGIFVTMLPALDYLMQHGESFGLHLPLHYYFVTGAFSAVLDNAPTYVNFIQLAQAVAAAHDPAVFASSKGEIVATTNALLQYQPLSVVGVSLGAVFFGAMTYIGNGPNLMVKSIAHEAGVHCPTFFGYIFRFSLPILLPILAISGWLFL